MFYIEELRALKEQYRQFDYEIFLSREETLNTKKGYVTNALSPDCVANFEEFYLCGGGTMIEDSKKLLLGF